MATEWYAQIDGTEFGPLSGRALKELIESGRIGPTTLVRKGTHGRWVYSRQLQRRTEQHSPADSHAPPIPTGAEIPPAGSSRNRLRLLGILALGVVAIIGAFAWRNRALDSSTAMRPIPAARPSTQPPSGLDVSSTILATLPPQPLPHVECLALLANASADDATKTVTRFARAFPGDQHILRIQAIEAARRNAWTEVRAASERLLSISTTNELTLTLKERADVELALAVALTQSGDRSQAYRYFKDAARDHPAYSLPLRLFERLCDETSPSERALKRATDVTGRSDVLSRKGINLNVSGVVCLNYPTFHEEVRGRLVRLLERRDVIVEVTDWKTSTTRAFLFPFSAIREVWIGVESEIGRYQWLELAGWDAYGFHDRLGKAHGSPVDAETGAHHGYYAYHLVNHMYGLDGSKNSNYKGRAELQGSIWYTKGRGTLLGEMSCVWKPTTVDSVVAAWCKDTRHRPALDVPYTWTRSLAEFLDRSWRNHDPELIYGPIAATKLNVPPENGMPYARYSPSSDGLGQSVREVGTFVNVLRSAEAKSNQSGMGQTAELVDLWRRMPDKAREDFVNGAIHTAQITATLIGTLQQIPYSRDVAPTALAATSSGSFDSSRHTGTTSRSTLIRGIVRHSNGSLVAEEVKVRVYPTKWSAASNVTLNLLSAHENIYAKNGRFSKEIVSESDSVTIWIEYGGKDEKYYQGTWESLDLEIVLSKPELTQKR